MRSWKFMALVSLLLTVAAFAATGFIFLDLDRVKSAWITLPMALFAASFVTTHRAFILWAMQQSHQGPADNSSR